MPAVTVKATGGWGPGLAQSIFLGVHFAEFGCASNNENPWLVFAADVTGTEQIPGSKDVGANQIIGVGRVGGASQVENVTRLDKSNHFCDPSCILNVTGMPLIKFGREVFFTPGASDDHPVGMVSEVAGQMAGRKRTGPRDEVSGFAFPACIHDRRSLKLL
jgi:hypothetical protein